VWRGGYRKATSMTKTIKLREVWEQMGLPGKPKKQDRNKLRFETRHGGLLRPLALSARAHNEKWEWALDDKEELGKVKRVLEGPSPPPGWDTKEYKDSEIVVD